MGRVEPRLVKVRCDSGRYAQLACPGRIQAKFRYRQEQRVSVANIKSQIKRNKQNEKRHERNKAVRSELKTRVRVAVAAAEAGADDTDAKVRAAVQRIDTAAAKGVIHKNQAARRKSRLIATITRTSTD
jgi:small subunit ribosomal protein S20